VEHLITNAIHKTTNKILDKTQKERREEWWIYDIEFLIEESIQKMFEDQKRREQRVL
jgi:hypothetical protein